MGYRNYFYLADKKTLDKVSKMTLQDIEALKKNEYDWLSAGDLIGNNCVHHFGKLYFTDMPQKIMQYSVPLFLDADVEKRYDEYSVVVVGEQGLLEAIECYRQNILETIKEDIEKDTELFTFDLKQRARFKQIELEKPYDGSEKSKKMFDDSWVTEYCMFNLIILHQTINWKTHDLVFMGY